MNEKILDKHTRKRRLFQLLLEIPQGKVVSYGEIARVLNTSPRGVAAMLSSNSEQDVFPCYKVVSACGKLSGYNLGTAEKIRRLRADGVKITRRGVLADDFFRFSD